MNNKQRDSVDAAYRRFIAIGLFAVICISVMTQNNSANCGYSLIFMLPLIYLLFGQSSNRLSTTEPREQDGTTTSTPDALNVGQKQGYSAYQMTDMGVIAYFPDGTSQKYRREPIPSGATEIHPFVVLDLMKAHSSVEMRFELYDDAGGLRFSFQDRYSLNEGLNLLMPSACFTPMDEQDELCGEWSLRVVTNDHKLASAEDKFASSKRKRDQVRVDGEIDEWVMAQISSNRLEPVSLDELLAEDETQPDELIDKTR